MKNNIKKIKWKIRRFFVKSFLIDEGKENSKKSKKISFAIFFSLIIGVIFLAIFGFNPFKIFYDAFRHVFTNGTFQKSSIIKMCLLGLSSIAAIVAFKAGVINIGISGQMLFGGVTSLSISIMIGNSVPNGIGQIIGIIIAISLGAFLAVLAGILKIFFKINEVVSTIMLNWLAFYFTKYLISSNNSQLLGVGGYTSKPVPENFKIASSSGDVIWISLLILLIVIIGVWFLMKKTKLGYDLKLTGSNIQAARYAGINVNKIIILSLVLSGAISGLLGVFMYMGPRDTVYPVQTADMIPLAGFDGIAIAIISFYNPWISLFLASLFAILNVGLSTVQDIAPSLTSDFSSFVLGVIMYFSAISIIFLKLRPILFIYKLYFGKGYYILWKEYIEKRETIDKKYFEAFDHENNMEKMINEHFKHLIKLKKEFIVKRKILKNKKGAK